MTTSRPLKVFLSYAFDDNPSLKKLYAFLASQGTEPWLDTEKLLPGQDWKLEIGKAMDEADVILVCLSKVSVGKEGYVQKEMRIALDLALEMPEGRIFLIPARLDDCEIPFRLRSYQAVDLFTESGMDKLIQSLSLRAKQIGVQPLLTDGAPAPEFTQVSKPRKSKGKSSPGTVVNINGNMTGNIVVGNDNQVNSD